MFRKLYPKEKRSTLDISFQQSRYSSRLCWFGFGYKISRYLFRTHENRTSRLQSLIKVHRIMKQMQSGKLMERKTGFRDKGVTSFSFEYVGQNKEKENG